MASTLIWLITIACLVIGLLGTFIPLLPGLGLIFIGILIFAIATNFTVITLSTVIICGVVALLASLASYFAGAVGAKVSGGSRRAVGGSLLGSVVGMVLLGPLGLPVGTFVGALLGALTEGRSLKKATLTARHAVIGLLSATLIQFVIGVSLIITFFLAVWW